MAAPFPMAALLAARPRRSDRGHPHRRGARRRHHRRGRGAGPDRHRTDVAVVAMASPRRRCRPDPPRPHRRRPCPAPPAPGFVIQDPTNTPIPPGQGGSDSAEAVRFKRALEQTGHLIGIASAAGAPPERKPINLGAVAATAIAGVEPRRTIPRRVFTEVSLPQRIIDDLQQPPARPSSSRWRTP